MAYNTIVTLYPYQSVHEIKYRGADRVINFPRNFQYTAGIINALPQPSGSASGGAPANDSDPVPGMTPSPFSPPSHGGRQAGPRIELFWDADRKSRLGFFIGASRDTCDIIIPEHESTFRGVSAVQGLFSFDSQNRLTYRDLRDPDRAGDGSAISFDGHGKDDRRRGFTWVLSGSDYLDEKKPDIILRLHKNLHFRVVVTEHVWAANDYIEAVNEFRNKPGTADGKISRLTLDSLSFEDKNITALATGAQTYSRSSLLINNGVLGSGTFGTVSCLYDVNKGIYIARKEPRTDARAFTGSRKLDWEKEIRLLKRVEQAATETAEARKFSQHVVRILDGALEPVPFIDLEYMPLGSLYEEHHDKPLNRTEVMSVFDQLLQALTFLHGLDPPVAHRDIKPLNVLVQHRDFGFAPFGGAKAKGIVVKLADFGLSKDETLRTVEIGTRRYMAPEICDDIARTVPGTRRPAYTTAVDIWALGVSIFELAYPVRFGNQSPLCKYICETVSRTKGDIATLVAQQMVVLNPENRSSARNILICLRNGLGNRPASRPVPQYRPAGQAPAPAVSSSSSSSNSNSRSSRSGSSDGSHMTARPPPPRAQPAPGNLAGVLSSSVDPSSQRTSKHAREETPPESTVRRVRPPTASAPPRGSTGNPADSRRGGSGSGSGSGLASSSRNGSTNDARQYAHGAHYVQAMPASQISQPVGLELFAREGSGSGLEIGIGFGDSRSQFSDSTDSRSRPSQNPASGQQGQQQSRPHAQAAQSQTPRRYGRPSGGPQQQQQQQQQAGAQNPGAAPPPSDSSFNIEDMFLIQDYLRANRS